MKYYLVYILLSFICAFSSAQDVVLDKDVEKQYKDKNGPNMRHYKEFYQAVGFMVPYEEAPGARSDLSRSLEYIAGYRFKRKLLSFYAIGYDFDFSWKKFGITPEKDVPVDFASNPLSQASVLEKMNLSVSSLGGEIYNRVNFGKRGNVLGKYLDIGIRGEWNFGRRLVLKQKAVKGDYYEKSRAVQKNLDFIEKFSALATARIGLNKLSIYGKYRLSDLISNGYTTPELTPLIIGVQFGF